MKKWILGLSGLAVAVLLAGCSSNGGSTVASMKGAKITEQDYYKELKKSSAGQQVLRSMIVAKALDQQYGDKVSDKAVDKQFKSVKSQYGSSFAATLSQNGYTESSFKDQVRTSLLSEAALKDLKPISKKKLEETYKTYEPKITVQHILVKTKDEAQKIIDQFAKEKNTTANFGKLAKKNSTDTGTKDSQGKLPAFDNTDTQLDADFKTAAFKLTKDGDYTKTPVKTQFGYHIIRMVSTPGKGKLTDAKTKKAVKEQIYTAWESDSTVMNSVLAKVLKKANVTIKDNDLKDVLSTYLDSSSSSKK